MSEFWALARWKMSIPPSATGIAGGIILPSGIEQPALMRRNLTKKYPHLSRRLLDPQLYLATLQAVVARGACANLASYGWFPLASALPPFDSGALKQADWKRQLKANITSLWTNAYPTGQALDTSILQALAIQVAFGVEALILPGPLTTDPSADFALEADWLRRGMRWADTLGETRPRYATVALSDRAIRGEDPRNHDLLEIILDQVTALDPSGVYLVLEQANENGYYITHPNTIGALLRLTRGFSSLGLPVIVNFVGTAGLLLVAAGASGWSTGWYRTERRLKMSDFEETTGRATPTYYTDKLASEVHLQYDMDRIVQAGLLSLIEDSTTASEDLIRALHAGQEVDKVPEWQHRQGNVTAAIEHLLLASIRDTRELSVLPDTSQRIALALQKLESATILARELFKLGNLNPRTATSHQEAWLRALQESIV